MGMDSAQVTAGGILTSEFDETTMESRLVPGLYACGEVLDIDGDCGGYNFTVGVELRPSGRTERREERHMIRLSDISLPPEHSAHQLPFEAARMLRIPNSKIRGVRIVRRRCGRPEKSPTCVLFTPST